MTRIKTKIESGLRYTEETGRFYRTLPVRDCFLWKKGVKEPVSSLNFFSFRQRIGALSIPSEGIGGLETAPGFRRQGYAGKLLRKALEGVPKRVKILYVSDAIEDLYESFGFVNCLAEGFLTLRVRDVERMAAENTLASNRAIRSFSGDDLPAMVSLYNKEHAQRPWSHERAAGWNRLIETQTWRPGSEVIVLAEGERLDGYGILLERQFGYDATPFVVDDLTARDLDAARAMLVELASRCWKSRIGDFQVNEPLDSTVGKAAQEMGCKYQHSFPATGGQMGVILDRPGLLHSLEPELRRRLPADELNVRHTAAFEALYRGEILPDDQILLRLLLGHWSLLDAQTFGTEIPDAFERICAAWFPGGGTRSLPLPFSHTLDRY